MSESPSPGDAVSFETQIKPLFREKDRGSMSFAFDLWSHEAVSANADAVANALRSGKMPCDGAWPQPRIDLFQRWIDSGKLP